MLLRGLILPIALLLSCASAFALQVTIDPGGASYYKVNFGGNKTGTQTFSLNESATHKVSLNHSDIYLQFSIDAAGVITTSSPYLTISGSTVTLNTIAVTLDPNGFISNYYVTGRPKNGIQTVYVVPDPGKLYRVYFNNSSDNNGFKFTFDASGNLTTNSTRVTQLANNVLQFNTVPVQFDPNGFGQPLSDDQYNVSNIGLRGTQTVNLVRGGTGSHDFGGRVKVYLQGSSSNGFYFDIDGSGQVSTNSTRITVGAEPKITFNTGPVNFDTASYDLQAKTDNQLLNANGVTTISVVPTGTGSDDFGGAYQIRLGGDFSTYGFKYYLDQNGVVTSSSSNVTVDGANTLTFSNTHTVTVDPNGYASSYRVGGIYYSGISSVNIMPTGTGSDDFGSRYAIRVGSSYGPLTVGGPPCSISNSEVTVGVATFSLACPPQGTFNNPNWTAPELVFITHGARERRCHADLSQDEYVCKDFDDYLRIDKGRPAVGDVNNDGYTDLMLDYGEGTNHEVRYCQQDASGAFVCGLHMVIGGSGGEQHQSFVDLNGDGHLDLARTRNVCWGDGTGNFETGNGCASPSNSWHSTLDVATDDFDNDGYADLIFDNAGIWYGSTDTPQANDPGTLLPDQYLTNGAAGTGYRRGVTIGDFNNDGFKDTFFVMAYNGSSGLNHICLNDGIRGSFSCTLQPHPAGVTRNDGNDANTGDFNEDGYVDVIIANGIYDWGWDQPENVNQLCLGDGAGNFACQPVSADQYASRTVETADLNGDGHLDSVFANYLSYEPNQVCYGDGAGQFNCVDMTSEIGYESWAVAIINTAGQNTLPVAKVNGPAGGTINMGEVAAINASTSFDLDGQTLTYQWAITQVPAGSATTLGTPTASNPTLIPDAPGYYVLSLIVGDGETFSIATEYWILSLETNQAPTADAGADQAVYVGDTVTLDGSQSSDVNGDLITYAWQLTTKPAGSAAQLSDATAVNPTFNVDVAGVYMAQLVVNDGSVSSVADTVSISTINVAPVANAGADQAVYLNNLVTLNGSQSTDADGDSLSYSWVIDTKPQGSAASLNDATAINPSFTVDVPGVYTVKLVVNDGTVNSEDATVTISTINIAPVADAGDDQAVYVGNVVTLNGSGSSDPDGDSLTYSWNFASRAQSSSASLSDANTVSPSFTVDTAGVYVVSLIVNDGTVNSPIVNVTISTINVPPVADAGDDQAVFVSDLVTLDASDSYDVDGDVLSYSWAFTSQPAGSTATLDDATSIGATFEVDVAGVYILRLLVNDGAVNSDPATVTISTINIAPTAEAGDDQAVFVGGAVTLNGSQSDDADGDALTYQWSFTSRPQASTATLSGANTVNPSFIVDVAGIYVVSLLTNDGAVNSAADAVTVSTINVSPVADAGDAVSVTVGNAVTLNGGDSSDADGDALTYSWSLASLPSGSAAALDSVSSVTPSFTPDIPGIYSATLIVSDGTVSSEPSSVLVTAVSVVTSAINASTILLDSVNALDVSLFKNNNSQKQFAKKVNKTIAKLEEGDTDKAIKTLEKDLLVKTDGCINLGSPDNKDVILDCTAQADIHAQILAIIDILQN